MKVRSYIELQNAIQSDEDTIEILNSISMPNGFKLGKGKKIIGIEDNIFLSFINGDGISLEGDNSIKNISIQTNPSRRAIYIDSSLKNLGTIELENLTITGVVQLLTRGENKYLSLKISDLDIISADARQYPERPMKYGVIVFQGALTIYNYSPDKDSEINVYAKNISVGRKNAPIIGSGIFIAGFNENGGQVIVQELTTGDVYSNGMIPTGQPNLITGGIFILNGANAKKINSEGTTVTYGTNDMVLDVWGSVDEWNVNGLVESYGPSAIGFVNFGNVKSFKANKGIVTWGLGARGFNQYDGTIDYAYFDYIKTYGDGSIGMQFSKPVGTISVGNSLETFGSTGETLVKGEIKVLKADALSVLDGGSIKEFVVLKDIVTHGDDVVSYHVNGGNVDKVSIGGSIIAQGESSKKVLIENNGNSDVENIKQFI